MLDLVTFVPSVDGPMYAKSFPAALSVFVYDG
jgi:hypothetical protein